MNDEEERKANWDDWIGATPEDAELDEFVEITPERVAAINLIECLEQLQRSESELLRLALAAKSAHLALQSALTAALAGSANIGAHPEKLRTEYLQHITDRGAGQVPRPTSDRVMSFGELLEEAMCRPMEWTGEALTVSPGEKLLLERLTAIRHGVEHPKQMSWFIAQPFITETLPVAARLTVRLISEVFHHLEAGELEQLQRTSEQIASICGR